MCCCDRKKRDACLSAASCASLPIAATQRQVPRRGDALRSPFFAYFLWRDKESEPLPGRPRQRTLVRRNTRQDFPTGNEDQERVNASNARFNFKTFTRGSPNKPHCGVSVCCCTNARILSAARPRSCATRAT